MRNTITSILFDLDGVIVFTDRYHTAAWKRLAGEQGWNFDAEIAESLRGVSRLDSLRRILAHNGLQADAQTEQAWCELKNRYYVDSLVQLDQSDLLPGVVPFIQALRNRGVRLALCSSSRNARQVLERVGLVDFFEVLVAGDQIRQAKPNPEIFVRAADLLGVHPYHCLVFEDAESGIQAAKAAHMRAIGVGCRQGLPSATEVITDYAEVDVDTLLRAARPQPDFDAEPWCVRERVFKPWRQGYWASILSLSNGMIGFRGAHEEASIAGDVGDSPGTFVNGFYEVADYHHALRYRGLPDQYHAIFDVCDWQGIAPCVDGELFSLESSTVSEYERVLDPRSGIVKRSLIWQTRSGRRVSIESQRLASKRRRHALVIRYAVTPADGLPLQVELRSRVVCRSKGRIFPGNCLRILNRDTDRQRALFHIATERSSLQAAFAVGHVLQASSDAVVIYDSTDAVEYRWQVTSTTTEPVVLCKHLALFTQLQVPSDALVDRVSDALCDDLQDGWAILASEERRFWDAYWDRADIQIDGPIADQQALRFNLFHLRQNHPERDDCSISATGLSGDNYSGHVFWDTEMYMVPPFLYSEPELVRSLLAYRYTILDRARAHAAAFDGQGALFAWNSLTGDECGIVYEAASGQLHINPDIGYAIWRYWHQTGDCDFLIHGGAETLFETARHLAHRGHFSAGRDGAFCINVVCGPDEYGCAVDNNHYTNAMIRFHLQTALKLRAVLVESRPSELRELESRLGLTPEEFHLWSEAAQHMVLPTSDKLGIVLQDDSFINRDPVDMKRIPFNHDFRWEYHPLNLWRMQVVKQADVLLLMHTLANDYETDVKRANYDYYEPLTNHGSSLSPSIHSIVAAEIGYSEDAYEYYLQSAGMDLLDFKNNTEGGIHMACLGGTWMAVINGFAGLRDYSDIPEFHPRLPSAWRSLAFRLHLHGRDLAIELSHDCSRFEMLKGAALTVRCRELVFDLTVGSPIAVPSRVVASEDSRKAVER